MRKPWIGLAATSLLFVGCAKTDTTTEPLPEPAAAPTPSENGEAMPSMTPEEHAKMGDMGKMGDQAAAEGAANADVCPVEGGKITSKAVFADYQGKRYYFCCSGCPKPFLENADKFIADHPEWAAKWSEDVPG